MFGRSVMFCFTPSWIYLLSSCLGGTQNKYDYGWIQDSLVLLMLLTLQYSINDKRGNPGGILSKNVVIVSSPTPSPHSSFLVTLSKIASFSEETTLTSRRGWSRDRDVSGEGLTATYCHFQHFHLWHIQFVSRGLGVLLFYLFSHSHPWELPISMVLRLGYLLELCCG